MAITRQVCCPLRALRRSGTGVFAFMVHLSDIQHLLFAAAVTVDGHALASFFICQHIDVPHIAAGSFLREVDRLRYSIVRMPLEGSLHADMINRFDIVSTDKHTTHFFRNILDVSNGSFFDDFAKNAVVI